APHVVQIGATPPFTGEGAGDLACRCGASVLIKGYVPASFLNIRIRCFHCGAVTATPGLPEGEILPRFVTPVAPSGFAAAATSRIPLGAVLACERAMAGTYARTRPREAPDVAMLLDRAFVEAAAADYDRLTGGRLAEHQAASPPAMGTDHGVFPFA